MVELDRRGIGIDDARFPNPLERRQEIEGTIRSSTALPVSDCTVVQGLWVAIGTEESRVEALDGALDLAPEEVMTRSLFELSKLEETLLVGLGIPAQGLFTR